MQLVAGTSGWLFGLAATVLLVGLWGRAMVVDTDQLAESLTPLATSEVIAERVSDWLESELVGSGLDGVTASIAAAEVLEHPAVGPLVEELVAEGVAAAASADPSGGTVDVGRVLLPAAGQITTGLLEAGVPVTQAQVEAGLAGLDPLVIREPSAAAIVGSNSPLATTLGTAVLLGVLLMVVSASAYVSAHRDRHLALRSLLNKFALGALSFAVLLKIGAWLVDPDGGRAPVGESLALLADSKWMVPLTLGLVSLAGGFAVWLFRKKVRPVAASPSQTEQPIRQRA